MGLDLRNHDHLLSGYMGPFYSDDHGLSNPRVSKLIFVKA
jgi:hypothetical protein